MLGIMVLYFTNFQVTSNILFIIMYCSYPDPCSPNSPDCTLDEEPVCAQKGTESISFYNMCFYEKEVCFDPTIKFISDGKCIPKIVLGESLHSF